MNTLKVTKKKATWSLWNYHRDEPSNPLSSNSKSFKYKASVSENTYNVDEKITEDDSNEVDNLKYDAKKVGKMKLKLLFH